MKQYKLELAMVLGLACAIFAGSTAVFARDCAQIQQDVVRLHILANSDSEEDQRLKLTVRDAILERTGDIFGQPQTQAQAKEVAREHLCLVEQIARETLEAQGCNLPVRAQVVNMFFETRRYDGFDLPAGRYDAIRVTIGAGAGRNWWCVVFPPMCITAAQPAGSAEIAQEILALRETPIYEPKLAIVEWYRTWQEQNP